jgi:hypothetical protein
MGLYLSVAPTVEPVTVDELKLHARIDISEDDPWIQEQLQAAREQAELYTGRAFVTQTLILKLDCFPNAIQTWGNRPIPQNSGGTFGLSGEIRLYRPPVQSISSITYVDTDGDSQTLSSSNYRVAVSKEPAILTPSYGNAWPSTRDQTEAVTITYVAGYGLASSVPASIKSAIRTTVAFWYENRESQELPPEAIRILQHYKIGEYR